MIYISFVSGAASALLQFFQPLDNSWIGHDRWASENLVLSAYLGGAIGTVLFFARSLLPKLLQYLILAVTGVGFVVGLVVSIYCSLNLESIVDYQDQAIYRDRVWKIAHLCGIMCLTVLLFCISFFEKKN